MMYKVNQHELVLELAQELKNHIEMPQWAQFVKTGISRETVPRNSDWWYIRAASILRLCFKVGPVGVNKLRTRYGSRKGRGVRPDQFALASGKVIRVILQQLQSADLVKEHSVGIHKGRIATATGASLLAKAAKKVGLPKQMSTKTASTTKKEVKETPKATEKKESESKSESKKSEKPKDKGEQNE